MSIGPGGEEARTWS